MKAPATRERLRQRPATAKKPRRRGRPSLAETTQLTKESVFERGLELARLEPLQDITITSLARDLGVTPALIHYLIPGRDGLMSGVMNTFYRHVCAAWPEPTGNWREHLLAISRHVNGCYLTYRGVVLYTATHNRYRLVQIVEEGETDYGLVFLDRLVRGTATMGLDAFNTALFCEVLVDFLIGQARATTGMRRPREHKSYLKGVFDKLDPRVYPGVAMVRDEMFKIDGPMLFEQGLEMLLDAFELHRAKLVRGAKSR